MHKYINTCIYAYLQRTENVKNYIRAHKNWYTHTYIHTYIHTYHACIYIGVRGGGLEAESRRPRNLADTYETISPECESVHAHECMHTFPTQMWCMHTYPIHMCTCTDPKHYTHVICVYVLWLHNFGVHILRCESVRVHTIHACMHAHVYGYLYMCTNTPAYRGKHVHAYVHSR